MGNAAVNPGDSTGLLTVSLGGYIDFRLLWALVNRRGYDPGSHTISVGAGVTAGRGIGFGLEAAANYGIAVTSAPTVASLSGEGLNTGFNTLAVGLAILHVANPGSTITRELAYLKVRRWVQASLLWKLIRLSSITSSNP